MAGIVSATPTQCEAAYRAAKALVKTLQLFNQSTLHPTALNSGQVTEVDALVDAMAAALAPLNT